tara:strand:- start:273 stop:512 length:240 start_codon:yes stop_codon:yes gene_type:complete
MTITQLKTKIREFEKALNANEQTERVNPILKEVLQESLINLQSGLITQLDELVDSFVDDDGLVEDVEDGKIVITAGDLI